MSEKAARLLEEIKALLEKYDETLKEFLQHESHHTDEKDKAHVHHLIHALRAELLHLEEVKHDHAETNAEKKAHFLQHHLEAARHATEHWYHLHHQLTSQLEEIEELEEIHTRILHLLNEISREKAEAYEYWLRVWPRHNVNCLFEDR